MSVPRILEAVERFILGLVPMRDLFSKLIFRIEDRAGLVPEIVHLGVQPRCGMLILRLLVDILGRLGTAQLR